MIGVLEAISPHQSLWQVAQPQVSRFHKSKHYEVPHLRRRQVVTDETPDITLPHHQATSSRLLIKLLPSPRLSYATTTVHSLTRAYTRTV